MILPGCHDCTMTTKAPLPDIKYYHGMSIVSKQKVFEQGVDLNRTI